MRFPDKSFCMQAEPVKYLHAGMVQHGPDQIHMFFHRTAEGKVYPFEYGYRKASGSAVVFKSLSAHRAPYIKSNAALILILESTLYLQAHYLTVPLSSRRASGVLGHDFKKMGFASDKVEHKTYDSCPHPFPESFPKVKDICPHFTGCSCRMALAHCQRSSSMHYHANNMCVGSKLLYIILLH